MNLLPIDYKFSTLFKIGVLTVSSLLFSVNVSHTQSIDPFHLNEIIKSEEVTRKNLFETDDSNKKFLLPGVSLFHLNQKNLQRIRNEFDPVIASKIPLDSHSSVDFIYTEYDFFTHDFNVNLLLDGLNQQIPVDKGIHLKGKMENDNNSFSSISVFQGEIYGTAYTSEGHKISMLPYDFDNTNNLTCMVIDEAKTVHKPITAGCVTDDLRQYFGTEYDIQYRTSDNCKSVNISVDIDYELYLKFKGNVQAITNYVTGLFNNVHTLYKRENISIALAQINIHATKDNFTHISASDDLEYFRKKYPNTNKTLKILLSGYTKANQPSLGGMANINTICLSTYSYAFANVMGTYVNAPVYSWDVFMVTHELGHILGSKHTHACAWGPNKNQAIDNCAKLEGTCALPGIPAKGTIMSYCYITGMPGIDLTLGFGKEPGDLIRSKVKSSACLGNYVPVAKTLDKANTAIEANLECSDGIYTHYYFDNNTIDALDDILLLSINKNGNDLGTINDGSLSIKLITTKNYGLKKANQITAAYVDKTKPWFVSNKYWEINASKKPIKPIDIKYYFNTKDLEDLKGSTGNFATNAIKLFQLLPPANPNPETNHANAQAQNFISFPSSVKKSINTYILSQTESNLYSMELNSQSLSSGGFGVLFNSAAFVTFKDMIISNENDLTSLDFKTNKELNCRYFIVERSTDLIQFDSIGKINSRGNSANLSSYRFETLLKDNPDVYYRVKARSLNNEVIYSPVFNRQQMSSAINSLSIYPSPVKSGVLFIDYVNRTNAPTAEIAILDIYGRILKTSNQSLMNGLNYININTSDLRNGMHYLRVICETESHKLGFTINQ